MKNIYKIILYSLIPFSIGLSSCEDYLDRDPESIVSEETAFNNYINFQGYIDEIYNCIPDKQKYYWVTSYNWGDDEIFNVPANFLMGHQMDIGNFWAWQNNDQSWLDAGRADPTSGDKFNHRLWSHAWYCIRKANMGIENLDRMVAATDEEKRLIEGQLYFFRGWWHFELMQFFGGLQYIDRVLSPSESLNLPRLSYQECADKAGADFKKAADLLPIDWDETATGKKNSGKNQLRINKIAALGYLGKNYLWAGSPLMKNGAQVGGSKTYDYDKTYCQKGADAFGELLQLVEGGETQYVLASFAYDDIYNHIKSGSEKSFSEIFYTRGQGFLMPGADEAIFRGRVYDANGSAWNFLKTWGPKVNGLVEHDNVIHHPTANYVNFYGMANGLPLDDPNSGFDPNYPFKDRDPRFYHDIIVDGFKYVNSAMLEEDEHLRYTGLHTGGTMRNPQNGSRTGYFMQKFAPHECNKYDQAYDWGNGIQTYLPYMRLGDVYLMYAEACAAIGGAQYTSATYGLTAEQAMNRIRERVGAGFVDASYVADNDKFMNEIRRERAVELSFEGFRFNDLQRWLLLTEYPYNVKTSHEFDRVETLEWFKENDCKDAQVANFREEIILTRDFGTKHYWLPLKVSDVSLYPEFNQNPGW
ncbi:RagB/SusD family nutrient uptake outer membrane protein [Carboxylicivirga caseinilyticus]|uniref:RagB/SusD family nutrient uptake outer membrane protein n=1 Tax=Carboxylicivirga caseinilyticus TaxID=3417572 RepID=UPI003D32BE2E|nr:RagB/SusD family nutrient uptake outer membrane protein [Marinilabiliaceae bacterium A049]